ncbi:MAG: HD domain-containing protein [Desulfitobacterium hafniense]|nr:HD domain-containing protein [Desulfitobacterium hafniense]
MFYRAKQFYKALVPIISNTERAWVKDFLPHRAACLFFQQSLVEQRHALDVAFDIKEQSSFLPAKDLKTLLTAALLHDCGKSIIKIKLWHRIMAVILFKIPNLLRSKLLNHCVIFSLPMKIANHHPIWGEKLSKQAGVDKDVQVLIRQHHDPKTVLGEILYHIDSQH